MDDKNGLGRRRYIPSQTEEYKTHDSEQEHQDCDNVIEPEYVEYIEEKPAAQTQRHALWIDIFAVTGVFIASLFVGMLVSLLVLKTAGASLAFSQFLGYCVTFGLTIGFSLWFLGKREPSGLARRFKLRRSNPTIILWGVILVFAASMVVEPLIDIFPEANLDYVKDIVTRGGWAMAMTVIAAPILEEILFRGILQEYMTREYGIWKGLIFASAIFGLAHIQIPQQAVNAFFVGLILGYIYIRTGSLLPVILIHAINNAIAFLLIAFLDKNMVTVRELVTNDTIYWILYLISVVVLVVAGYNLNKGIKLKEAEK